MGGLKSPLRMAPRVGGARRRPVDYVELWGVWFGSNKDKRRLIAAICRADAAQLKQIRVAIRKNPNTKGLML